MNDIPAANEAQLPPPSLDPTIPIEQELPQPAASFVSEYQDNKSDVFKEAIASVMKVDSEDGSGAEFNELSESNMVRSDGGNMEDNESEHEDYNSDDDWSRRKRRKPCFINLRSP
jgi:hypothetical protein